jgi:hypothetical protein
VYDDDPDFAYPYIQLIDPTKLIAADEAAAEFCNVHLTDYNNNYNPTSAAQALLSKKSKPSLATEFPTCEEKKVWVMVP